MTFLEWIRENTVTLDDCYSKTDMEWFAEQAWYDGIREGRRQMVNERIHDLVNGER